MHNAVVAAIRACAVLACTGLTAILTAWSAPAQAQDADTILSNGKIVTVDDQFRIAQSLAVRGERIVAVGTNTEVARFKGPKTLTVDLTGHTVIPGLIDNHAYFMRAAEYWHREVRLDGVTSHKQALEMLANKAHEFRPGEWVLVLGGWSEEQFTDEPRGFTRLELDAVAAGHPVALQLLHLRVYANSAALKALGIDANTPDTANFKIGRDSQGRPTGVLNGAAAVFVLRSKLGEVSRAQRVENVRALMHDLNVMGITAFQDQGGTGFKPSDIEPFQLVHDAGQMTVRAFYNHYEEPNTPADVENLLRRLGRIKPFQGDDWFGLTGYGATMYSPLHDELPTPATIPTPAAMAQWRRLGLGLAQHGLPVNVHAQPHGSVEAMLGALKAINAVHSIRGLRWTFSHLDQVDAGELDRMKRLNLYVQVQSNPTIQGGLMLKAYGDSAYRRPPLRLIQDSGIPWGLGSDATVESPSNPFYTLWWAVSGDMIGGRKVNFETITREEALIAHTRSNAAFLFEEGNLGSLAPGKYADLLVLGQDYLTVPVQEIKNVRPYMTMVGGKFVNKE